MEEEVKVGIRECWTRKEREGEREELLSSTEASQKLKKRETQEGERWAGTSP